MHSAAINQIRATPDFERLVTVSEDKSLRVWRVRDLKLMRVIHVPSEAGEEGALRSLAITRDGRQVIVGGLTGLAWSDGQRAQAYRFDLATGRLLQVFRGFPAAIQSMSISHDGLRLAVGLGRGAGLRVLDLATGATLWADGEYAERVSFADFSAGGMLATTSADGCVRVYTGEGRLVFRSEYPPRPDPGLACRGSALGGVRFSPDGRLLAFGLQDRVEIIVMDVKSLSIVNRLRVNEPAQRSLCCPNWSVDGKQLHMHGAFSGDGPTPLYRVTLATGAIERLPVGRQRFTNVLPLQGGDLLLSTTAPSLARLSNEGDVIAEATPPNGDFRFSDWRLFRVSENGERLQIPMSASGGDVRYFNLAAPPDRALQGEAGRLLALQPPRRGDVSVVTVLDDFGYQHPTVINGQPVRLKAFQSVRSWAAGRASVVLGTQWSVLTTDMQGKPLWEQDLPAPAYQVTVSGSGRFVVAAVGDGSLRWYAADTGREVLGAFLHSNGTDWVAWRPDGYYASSPGGDEYLGWLINRGDEREPDFLRAVQFERKLYRPDLVRAAVSEGGRTQSQVQTLAATLKDLAPPRVTIESIEPVSDSGRQRVSFSVESTGRPLLELGVYVDGLPVLRTDERNIVPAERTRLVRSVLVPASASSTVRVEAESEFAIGVDETVPLQDMAFARAGKGKLWVVSAGVQQFDNLPASLLSPLSFTTNDARDLAAALADQSMGQAHTDVRSVVLTEASPDGKPTKANLLRGLQALEQAQPEDTILVFMSSHGITDASEYYLVTKDSKRDDVNKVLQAQKGGTRLAEGEVPSLLSGTELAKILRRLPGRRILMLDTCHSEAAGGAANPYALFKRSASAQVALISAAKGDEQSWGSPGIGHSLFTIEMINALRSTSETKGRGPVTIRSAFDKAAPRVQEVLRVAREREKNPALREQLRQTPVLSALPVLQSTVMAVH